MRYLYIHVQDPKTPKKEIVWVTDLDDLLQKHGLTYKKLPLPSQMEDLFKKMVTGQSFALVCWDNHMNRFLLSYRWMDDFEKVVQSIEDSISDYTSVDKHIYQPILKSSSVLVFDLSEKPTSLFCYEDMTGHLETLRGVESVHERGLLERSLTTLQKQSAEAKKHRM